MNYGPTPTEAKQYFRKVLAEEIVQENMIKINIKDDFTIQENIHEQNTSVSCILNIRDLGKKYEYALSGSGAGPVDAFFTALMNHLSPAYTSLETFTFLRFGVEADLKSSKNTGSSADVEAMIIVGNNRGDDSIFRVKSTSFVRASVSAVLESVEFFVNVEKAVKILKALIEDGRKRNRGDIVEHRTRQLADLVGTTSYNGIIGKK